MYICVYEVIVMNKIWNCYISWFIWQRVKNKFFEVSLSVEKKREWRPRGESIFSTFLLRRICKQILHFSAQTQRIKLSMTCIAELSLRNWTFFLTCNSGGSKNPDVATVERRIRVRARVRAPRRTSRRTQPTSDDSWQAAFVWPTTASANNRGYASVCDREGSHLIAERLRSVRPQAAVSSWWTRAVSSGLNLVRKCRTVRHRCLRVADPRGEWRSATRFHSALFTAPAAVYAWSAALRTSRVILYDSARRRLGDAFLFTFLFATWRPCRCRIH